MHFEDLALCNYDLGPFDASAWYSPLLTIGWLEHPHPFPTGYTKSDFIARLESLIAASCEHYSSYGFRGVHTCSICSYGDRRPARPVRCQLNIWVPGDGVIYIAPGTITHYVGDHEYQPPTEFVHAVLDCPDCGSPAYCSALRDANGDCSPPLLTKAEEAAEWAQIRDLAKPQQTHKP
jgi:hypothetical protein